MTLQYLPEVEAWK